jgi:hypothetical protein
VPLKGTVEVVPNPNAGGIGVPLSTWITANPTCPTDGPPIDPQSGSWSTCERHEWYGTDAFPADYKCPTKNCACKKSDDKLLSYAAKGEKILGIDVLMDERFPCDIFKYTFGVAKHHVDDYFSYTKVRDMIPPAHRLSGCSTLDKNSEGPYWISGSDCDIKDQVGSATNPVLLISAAANTKINAGAEIFGILFVTNAEVDTAQFSGNGHATIYGAAIMDGAMEHFNGTFQIVYIGELISQALDTGAFGAVQGGWTDFHASWQ